LFLFDGQVDTTPQTLVRNQGFAFRGGRVWGSGFLFEADPSGGSSSIEDMNRIVGESERNLDVIRSYMGGEEFNRSPTQAPERFVIDFGKMSEAEARLWPALFAIVEARVKPVRAGNKQRNYREEWWIHSTRVPEALEFSQKHGRILAFAQVSRHLSVAFVPPGAVLADTLIVALFASYAGFATLQARIHEAWARFFGSSMKDDPRYTTTDCFETFPFPSGILPSSLVPAPPALESAGELYYDHRAALMVANNEGLTKTYNRFHDPDERSPGILQLRDLHAAMDRAVLDAYGWADILPVYDFRPQLDESIRYTWAEETRDDVLARLLELNRTMAAQEAAEAAAQSEEKKAAKKTPARKRAGKKQDDNATLALPLGDLKEKDS
jgi:hypothetical protein